MTNTPQENLLDLLATQLAEIRLSELGYSFIPGVSPAFVRSKKIIEVKAHIIKNQGTSV